MHCDFESESPYVNDFLKIGKQLLISVWNLLLDLGKFWLSLGDFSEDTQKVWKFFLLKFSSWPRLLKGELISRLSKDVFTLEDFVFHFNKEQLFGRTYYGVCNRKMMFLCEWDGYNAAKYWVGLLVMSSSTNAIIKETNGRVIFCWIDDILLNIKYLTEIHIYIFGCIKKNTFFF